MSNQDTTIVRCPSCGAPINMGKTRGTCDYCETVVERQNTTGGEPKFVRVHIAQARPRARPTQSNAGTGCVITFTVGILLFVGFILAVSGALPIGPLASRFGITNNGWPLFGSERIMDLIRAVPRDGANDDLLVFIDRDEDLTLGLIDSSGATLRWQSAPLSKDGRQASLVLGPETVYVADQTQLLALRLSDGTPAWQAALPVEPAQGCDQCLMMLGDHLLVWRKDNTLQSIEAQTGRPAWSKRLEGPPRRLLAINGELALAQPAEGQSGAEIRLIDPVSGAVTQRISPGCEEEEPERYSATFYADSFFQPSTDGRALITIFEGSAGCAQRWDLEADQPAWQTWLEEDIVPSYWDERHIITVGHRLFFAGDGTLSTLDTETGEVSLLLQDDEYALVPLFARGEIVVVKATPDWDSARHSLWGLDTATGERRWQYDVAAEEWFGDSGFNEWGAQLTPAGLAVVFAPGDAHTLTVERLDFQTGVSVGRQVVELDDSSSSTVWDNRWTDRRAWLLINSTLYVVDLMSGEITSQPL